MKQTVSVVITDLDNTLYDWLRIWHEPFRAMLDKLVEISGVSEEQLAQEIQRVYQKHGTSEYAFLIEELPSLVQKHPGEDLTKVYSEAIDAYVHVRREVLELYPGVLETLQRLKDAGVLLVAYTESMAYYSRYRMRKLGLDRIIDYLFSTPDHELPGGLTREQIRRYDPERYQLRRTRHERTAKGERKPNPALLLEIITTVGAVPEEVVYVGDNLMKDVGMAQAAGVTDVWARYGETRDRPEYDLLRQVTHWSEAEVETESAEQREPSWVLVESFSEINDHFSFRRHVDRSDARMKLAVEAWKKTVDVQQHFNELELRIRNYAVTILAAMVGATVLVLKEGYAFTAFDRSIPVASVLLLGAACVWSTFYFMDRWWYHRLLYGAVRHGRFIEARLGRDLPEAGLTQEISRHSPMQVWPGKIRSTRKMDIFYGAVFSLLLAAAVLVLFALRPIEAQGTGRSVEGQQAAIREVEE